MTPSCGVCGGEDVRTTIHKEAACYGVTELQIDLQLMTARAQVRQGFTIEKYSVSL